MSGLIITVILTACVPEPILDLAPIEQWQYRTKIDGRPDKCWYVGRRMKPRDQLYWAPAPPPETPFEQRWKGDVR